MPKPSCVLQDSRIQVPFLPPKQVGVFDGSLPRIYQSRYDKSQAESRQLRNHLLSPPASSGISRLENP